MDTLSTMTAAIAAWAIATNILNQLDSLVLTYGQAVYTTLVGNHLIAIRLMMILYVAIYGWTVIQRWTDASVKDASKHVFKMALVYFALVDINVFGTFFYELFVHGPDSIVSVLAQKAGGGSMNSAIDKIAVAGFGAAAVLGVDNGLAGESTTLWILTATVVGAALILQILVRLGMALTLAVGPLFVAFLLFDETKRFFMNWLGMLFNLAMTLILAAGAIALLLKLFDPYIVAFEGLILVSALSGAKITFLPVAMFAVFAGITTLVLKTIPGMANALTSSFASFAGDFSSIEAAMGKKSWGGSSSTGAGINSGAASHAASQGAK